MKGKVFIYMGAALAGAAAAFFLSGIFYITTVTGAGMEPELRDGTTVIINKTAYMDSSPEIGDIAAFKNRVYGENGESGILVRRVAAGPGDSVEIKDNIFYLNGKPYDKYMNEAVHMEDMDKVNLDESSVFLLNDNRKALLDSRDEAVGVLKVKDLLGKVCFK
ncbi:MAG TPA: signal peptidase I [Candidatus Copromorpha excrementigallinarum]|uniref:Signal peptidase I n=1 Tax=Candidatus Allocopromorpha excrementigallinarum TaxID=2840742 RepID=A0A9D1I1C7_9FIRM|nr:signal peptidase I [Candidatus Copromorpha excrementigallinarum]